jgi:oligopeptide transport system substrate-binding protein
LASHMNYRLRIALPNPAGLFTFKAPLPQLIAVLIFVLTLITLSGLMNDRSTNAATTEPESVEAESYADFDSSTGIYVDTLRGFSLKIPTGWVGTEITDSSAFLEAFDDPVLPTLYALAFLLNSEGQNAQEAMNGIADLLLVNRTEPVLLKSESVAAPDGTSAHRLLVDWKSAEGIENREEWVGFVRGSSWVVLQVSIAVSDHEAKLAQIDEFVSSFAWETPTPYGASKDDSLFLAGGEIRTIDPVQDRGSAGGIATEIFSGLVVLDTNIEIAAEIASSWEIDDSGLVYTFHLNPSAVFHDGRQITAEDVKYSWERAAEPATESPTVLTYLGDIVGIDAMNSGDATTVSGLVVIDDVTLQVTIEKPIQYFLQKLTYPTALIVDRYAVEAGGEDWTDAPNGSGPFKLKQWDKDEVMVLERHEEHYTVVPKLKHIVYMLFAGRPMTMYENDEIDMVGVGGSNIERVTDPANALNADLVIGDNYCTSYLWFNTAREPFSDVFIREAFAKSIDIDKVVEVSLKGTSTRSTSLLPPGIPGHLERPNAVQYDVAAALTALKNSPLSIQGGAIDVYGVSAPFLSMWKENLGAYFVSIDVVESDDWLERRDAGEFLFGTTGWCADYPDPQNFLEILFHSESQENSTGYSNSEFDRLVEEAAVETNPDVRIALYQQAEDLLIENYVMVPLWRGQSRLLVKPWVKNAQVTPIGVRTSHLLEIQR